MGGLLGGDEFEGPSAAELRRRELERSRARQKTVRAQAIRNRKKGVTQLFSPNNPALNIPNNDGGNDNNA